jgi:preprotein translocase subunit SecD
MNRYPLWKYVVLVLALAIGLLFSLPNVFGEAPAVQLSSGKATVKLTVEAVAKVEGILKAAGLAADFVEFDNGSIKARFKDTETQLKARDALGRSFNPDAADPHYIVALNLVTRSPLWLRSLHANPMFLGLDLRGGVHFLMQVDMKAALTQKVESMAGDLRTLLRDKDIRHGGIRREGDTLVVRFRDEATRKTASSIVSDSLSDLNWLPGTDASGDLTLTGTLRPESQRKIQEQALKQNITTLHNRINELGVSEPVIQQQGTDRVVVQLPGVQDTAKAKDIIGRTATLEVRMVDDSTEAQAALSGGAVPFGTERFNERGGVPLIAKRQVVLTGDNLTDAQPGFDENHEAAVHLTLDSRGARIFRDVTRESIGKRMAIILFEKGKGEVVTAPVIRGEISGGRVQISGRMSAEEAADTALLLRAGSLAAPMEIIEERTVGPSLGAENIAMGFSSLMYGFLAIAVFMMVYYMLFGVFSTIALSVNLLLLVAVLSMLQATLTLPGIAAIALTLGMAIDSNVLINERVREELRNGAAPQSAISAGYEHAWATILDSNVTTLIAGMSLLAFGSGPVRGFAVVHCLGILTSMFSAVFFSRGLVNFWYGRQKKLKSVSIGQVWKAQE